MCDGEGQPSCARGCTDDLSVAVHKGPNTAAPPLPARTCPRRRGKKNSDHLTSRSRAPPRAPLFPSIAVTNTPLQTPAGIAAHLDPQAGVASEASRPEENVRHNFGSERGALAPCARAEGRLALLATLLGRLVLPSWDTGYSQSRERRRDVRARQRASCSGRSLSPSPPVAVHQGPLPSMHALFPRVHQRQRLLTPSSTRTSQMLSTAFQGCANREAGKTRGKTDAPGGSLCLSLRTNKTREGLTLIMLPAKACCSLRKHKGSRRDSLVHTARAA